MEGTWGRRIYGSITSEDECKLFRLQIDLEPRSLVSQRRVSKERLLTAPWLYQFVLDDLTRQLESMIRESNKNTP